jgi:phosphate acetyltransferase
MTTELLLLLHDYYHGCSRYTILGSKKQIENKVAELGIAFDFESKIISPLNHYEDYVNTYYELRKKKM